MDLEASLSTELVLPKWIREEYLAPFGEYLLRSGSGLRSVCAFCSIVW